MTKRLGLTITDDEHLALEQICHKYEISKAEWVRYQIRLWHSIFLAEKAHEEGAKTYQASFQGFGYFIDFERLEQIVEEAKEGFTLLAESQGQWLKHFEKPTNVKRTRREKKQVRRPKAA